ncbi:hypothetical protein D3C73_798560 [compost metagenome]
MNGFLQIGEHGIINIFLLIVPRIFNALHGFGSIKVRYIAISISYALQNQDGHNIADVNQVAVGFLVFKVGQTLHFADYGELQVTFFKNTPLVISKVGYVDVFIAVIVVVIG